MKKLITIVGVVIFASFLLTSCGQNNLKQKELELKERELALKEKELDLKVVQKSNTSYTDSTNANKEQKVKTEQQKVTNAQNKPIKAKFVDKNRKLILVINSKEFIIQKDFNVIELNQGTEKGALAVCSIGGGSGGTTWTAKLNNKNGEITVVENAETRGGGETNGDERVVLKIKKGDY